MHHAHDYRHLVARWQAVCRAAGVRLRRFAVAGKYPLYYVETRAPGPAVYLSAGIHGDEPAGPEALITWAESDPGRLQKHALLIFPCLNPWGLVNNIRLDADGLDLNRIFHCDDHPFVTGWRKVLGERRFEAAIPLHEDFDGQGLYLYQIQRKPPLWGSRLLHAAHGILPIEGRARIDTFAAEDGIIHRPIRMAKFRKMGFPEAVWLHLRHSERTFTIEAPSEFALEQRAAGLRAVVEAALEEVAALRRT